MRLYTKCSKCKEEMKFTSSYLTRGDISMYQGKSIKLKCDSCGIEEEVHINDVYAKKSKLAIGIAAFIFLVGTPVIIYFLVAFTASASGNPFNVVAICSLFLLPVFMYIIIHKQDQIRVNSFNRYKV